MEPLKLGKGFKVIEMHTGQVDCKCIDCASKQPSQPMDNVGNFEGQMYRTALVNIARYFEGQKLSEDNVTALYVCRIACTALGWELDTGTGIIELIK